jgi:hypothetical protein
MIKSTDGDQVELPLAEKEQAKEKSQATAQRSAKAVGNKPHAEKGRSTKAVGNTKPAGRGRSGEQAPSAVTAATARTKEGNKDGAFACPGAHQVLGNYLELFQASYFEGRCTYVGSHCEKCAIEMKGTAYPGTYLVSKASKVWACSYVHKGCTSIYCQACFGELSAGWPKAARKRKSTHPEE